ncbi:Acrylyl-CoA reductase AcuI [Hartmannibacter diazotrophicus]|uniref:Acrylyl-CoA reductase AcuI n=1 Tax=Hartmannibacter diazotrophicus TaxID=1482074 RepID=A0A2C9D3I1_9HYPH|nr:MDR family oxidoreductase [Hartmannibacter diazotrophicus]SON54718.1 Acrylyl-CoA reductase AcuI [Hartmannibacter diazotrophicus]
MDRFKAILVERDEAKKQSVRVAEIGPEDLMDGNVTVHVDYSTVNYKDGLAITGKLPVVRRWPMIPGIDFAGRVVSSDDPVFKPGDEVVLNGWGVGEAHLGAYAQYARVNGDWLIHKPEGLSPAECMMIGTAGYTAMLCVLALEKHGLDPRMGPVVVSGASGGVGTVAISLLAKLGWHVIAVTGRTSEADFLKSLGAAEIIDRAELSETPKLLAKERWIAGVDTVGSTILANILSMTTGEGAVAACGNAQGMDLPTSVAPFILRGVSLLGVNSVTVPREKRIQAWERLATDLDKDKLKALTTEIGFDDLIETAKAITEGKVRGRVVAKIG